MCHDLSSPNKKEVLFKLARKIFALRERRAVLHMKHNMPPKMGGKIEFAAENQKMTTRS
jgi:hypothetical protein